MASILSIGCDIRRPLILACDDVRKPHDRRQWRPKLVAHVRKELGLRAIGDFGPVARLRQFHLARLDVGDVDECHHAAAARRAPLAHEHPPAGVRQPLEAPLRLGMRHQAFGEPLFFAALRFGDQALLEKYARNFLEPPSDGKRRNNSWK